MIITVLGSGTSTGVPVPGCDCSVCHSSDPRNSRFRTSIAITTSSENMPTSSKIGIRNIIIDTGPDFRSQVLKFGIRRVDAVLFTHTHADHIFGLDDLRSYNFAQRGTIPLYAGLEHQDEIRRIFRYVFDANLDYLGGALPDLELKNIAAYQSFNLFGLEITPLPLEHGLTLTYGFRINDFAFLTDCSGIPARTKEHLYGLKCLILDALREHPHRTHFNHHMALEQISALKPQKAFLIHISHECDHEATNNKIQSMSSVPVSLAYDGMQIEI